MTLFLFSFSACQDVDINQKLDQFFETLTGKLFDLSNDNDKDSESAKNRRA